MPGIVLGCVMAEGRDGIKSERMNQSPENIWTTNALYCLFHFYCLSHFCHQKLALLFCFVYNAAQWNPEPCNL